jgi:hypothetical protein
VHCALRSCRCARPVACIIIPLSAPCPQAIQQALAWSTYLAVSYVLPAQKALLDEKFKFLHAYDLGYVFLAVWIVALARNALSLNANSARAGARVGRPDQHVYKVCAPPEPCPASASAPAGQYI